MPHLSPIQIAVIVIAVVSLIGVIITTIRKSAVYTGYSEFRNDIEKIGHTLKLDLFRDGDDIVLTGNHKKKPVQIRFSYSETTPGLNIRMQAPVSFTFSVVPKGERATEGRVLVRTGDDMFDARFAARTDHPTQAKMLVSSKPMRVQMEKLCCSSKTFLTLTTGNIELSELIIPQPYTSRHVLDHIESMSILADAVDDIPGAEKIKITPYAREKSTPVFRIAVAIGAIAALIAVFAMQHPDADNALADSAGPQPEGVLPVEAPLIPLVERWHAAKPEDFSPLVANWMRSYGVTPEGRFELDLDGSTKTDVAYFLLNEQGKRRVVLLKDRVNIYDSLFDNMVGVVRVPKSSLENVEWKTKPSEEPSGDVLMIIRGEGDNISAMVIFPANGRMVAAVPAHYENIGLK